MFERLINFIKKPFEDRIKRDLKKIYIRFLTAEYESYEQFELIFFEES